MCLIVRDLDTSTKRWSTSDWAVVPKIFLSKLKHSNYMSIATRGTHVSGIQLHSLKIYNKRVVFESLNLKYVINV